MVQNGPSLTCLQDRKAKPAQAVGSMQCGLGNVTMRLHAAPFGKTFTCVFSHRDDTGRKTNVVERLNVKHVAPMPIRPQFRWSTRSTGASSRPSSATSGPKVPASDAAGHMARPFCISAMAAGGMTGRAGAMDEAG
jgi:hypothetical protein